MNRTALGFAVACLLLVAACAAPTQPNLLTIYGAASLADALDELVEVYTSTGTPPSFAVSTGSSPALRTQIEHGAPADLFLSADTANAQAVVDAGLADGVPVPFATNRLTIIVPKGNPAAITSLGDLGRAGIRVIAAGMDVPVTKYAEQALAGVSGGRYSPGLEVRYESNIVSREDNVGAVTAKIALGEGDAAIVYVTDALAANVDTVEIPTEANVVATYAAAVMKAPRNVPAARLFLDWLKGPNGEQILIAHGFAPAT